MNQRPLVRGLQVCQQVIVEERTRNWTLVNCFSRLETHGFPSEPFQFDVHAVLCDGKGDVELRVVIYRLADRQEVFQKSMGCHFKNRLNEYRIKFPVKGLRIPSPGRYEVSLVADNEEIGQTCFVVVL